MELAETRAVSTIGLTSADRLRNLPTGAVFDVAHHLSEHEAIPSARTVIIPAYRIWDPIFKAVAKGPKLDREDVRLKHEARTAILTSELEPDRSFSMDLCGECNRYIDAYPTKALRAYKI